MTTNNSQMTSTLLWTGIIAGPFFIIVALLQAFTREGFDLIRHPASLLSLGDLGWIQIANFVITGFFFIACNGSLHLGVGKLGGQFERLTFETLGVQDERLQLHRLIVSGFERLIAQFLQSRTHLGGEPGHTYCVQNSHCNL